MKIKMEIYCVKFIKSLFSVIFIRKTKRMGKTLKNLCQVVKNRFVNPVVLHINLTKFVLKYFAHKYSSMHIKREFNLR